jgi:hypothetical protein
MRPGQNKRMRGRNNNHRKGPNPLTRTYESNGPDVKIRGTAHHVAEKYLQLARDAQSSGDPVMAESYLQHAEHYFRLIAAAQLAQQQAQMGTRPGSDDDDSDDDEDFSGLPDRFASPIERQPVPPPFPANGQQQPQGNYPNPNQPQPYGDRPQQPQGERQYQDRPQGDRNQGDRQYQDRGQDRGPRQDRNQERPFFDRNNQNRNRNNNRDNNQNRNNGPRDFQPEAPRFDNQPEPQQISRAPAVEPDVPVGLPSFITAPVRTVMPDAPQPVAAAPNAPVETGAEHEEAAFHLRNRRRRRPKAAASGDGEVAGPLSDEVPVGE